MLYSIKKKKKKKRTSWESLAVLQLRAPSRVIWLLALCQGDPSLRFSCGAELGFMNGHQARVWCTRSSVRASHLREAFESLPLVFPNPSTHLSIVCQRQLLPKFQIHGRQAKNSFLFQSVPFPLALPSSSGSSLAELTAMPCAAPPQQVKLVFDFNS